MIKITKLNILILLLISIQQLAAVPINYVESNNPDIVINGNKASITGRGFIHYTNGNVLYGYNKFEGGHNPPKVWYFMDYATRICDAGFQDDYGNCIRLRDKSDNGKGRFAVVSNGQKTRDVWIKNSENNKQKKDYCWEIAEPWQNPADLVKGEICGSITQTANYQYGASITGAFYLGKVCSKYPEHTDNQYNNATKKYAKALGHLDDFIYGTDNEVVLANTPAVGDTRTVILDNCDPIITIETDIPDTANTAFSIKIKVSDDNEPGHVFVYQFRWSLSGCSVDNINLQPSGNWESITKNLEQARMAISRTIVNGQIRTNNLLPGQTGECEIVAEVREHFGNTSNFYIADSGTGEYTKAGCANGQHIINGACGTCPSGYKYENGVCKEIVIDYASCPAIEVTIRDDATCSISETNHGQKMRCSALIGDWGNSSEEDTHQYLANGTCPASESAKTGYCNSGKEYEYSKYSNYRCDRGFASEGIMRVTDYIQYCIQQYEIRGNNLNSPVRGYSAWHTCSDGTWVK